MVITAEELSAMKVAAMLLLIIGMGAEAAPTERDPHPGLTHASALPEKSSALGPSRYLKQWLLSSRAAGADRATKSTDRTSIRTITAGVRTRLRTEPATASPDKQAQMLRMISALEELHRIFNSTLSSRITIMPRANGRTSGRKHKTLAAADRGLRQTTAAPAADSTASRASTHVLVPSLTGQNFRKSLPAQTRKTNKRVCFWKYCSQN